MIKYLLLVISVLLVSISYYPNVDNVTDKYKLDGLVIEYHRYNCCIADPPIYEIKLYADKYLTYGYNDSDDLKKVELTDEEYFEIINYAFSNRFMSLKKGLTDPNVLDGSHSSITLYASGGIIYSNGGDNVTNSRYNKLVNLLKDKERK